ncbi:MAG: xanthine dehydrogenase family protein subunit M [Pseudomonadota bacterium]
MYSFKFHRASSVADSLASFGQYGDARFLAGGQTLLASLKLRLAQPDGLVDLGQLAELKGIHVVAGQSITLGAMTTHAEVAGSPEVAAGLGSLSDMASHIGDPMVRHMGTMGGSVANNDPAADWPAAVLALDATVVTAGRRIKADDFFLGMFSTALEAGELITAIEFRVPRRSAYVKFRHPASRFALVGVFVADFGGDIRVAVTGAGAGVMRMAAFEDVLQRQFSADALAHLSVDSAELNTDMHATAEYRANLVRVMAMRAVAKASGAT